LTLLIQLHSFENALFYNHAPLQDYIVGFVELWLSYASQHLS